METEDGRPGAAPGLPFMVSDRGVALALGLTAAVVALFAAAPGLDLAAAGIFYAGDGRFILATPSGVALRRLFYLAPFALLLGAGVLYALRSGDWRGGQRGGRRGPAPTGRAMLALVLSLALGPGLLVNVGLKDHWHRPRPAQVAEFGGTETFRPVGPPGGGCARNCSFVSGEGASSFWSTMPALMAPPPVRGAALAAALLYAAATGLLRMGFGGHFLSDTLLAALLTWLVVAGVWRAVLGARSPRAEG